MSYRVPGFSYPGGKVKLREWMVRRMPMSGGKYVEPFAGRGNVFWLAVHMLDFREWWLNDPWTARWFEAIQRVDLRAIPNELDEFLVRLYRDRAVKHRETDDEAVALEGRTMFAGGAKSGITHNWKRAPSLIAFKRKIVLARNILKSVQPKITDFTWEKQNLVDLDAEDFVYLDPPYENASKSLYHCSTVDHKDLLLYLREASHLWMLSGYRSPLYLRHLGDPSARTVYRVYCCQQKNRQGIPVLREECIWTNYTIGADGIPKRKRLKMRRISKKRIGK